MPNTTKPVLGPELIPNIILRKISIKPLFNEMNLLSLHHLYIYHTFIDTLKLLKYRIPMSLCELLKNSQRNTNMLLLVPLIRLDLAKNNFIFQASCIWNGVLPIL